MRISSIGLIAAASLGLAGCATNGLGVGIGSGYGGGYGNYGGGYATGDAQFDCTIDRYGRITDIDAKRNRNYGYRRY